MTSIAILIVTLLAATSIAALGIDAVLLAQMIPSRAFVEVSAADAVGVQDEASWAGTDETSFCVLAVVLAGLRR